MKTTKIEPTQKDGMPYEVATAMLCEPKAKLTNRMRKTCWAARTKEYSHGAPMEMLLEAVGTRRDGTLKYRKLGYHGPEAKEKDPEAKAVKRFSECTWAQVNKWLLRAVRRRMAVQRRFQKVQATLEKSTDHREQKRLAFALNTLGQIAINLETIMDAAQTVLEKRDQKIMDILARRASVVYQLLG